LNRVRLNRFLAQTGVGSRRACDEIIKAGRVEIDGEICLEPGRSLDPGKQDVKVDGAAVKAEEIRVYLLNKPPGILSTVSDPHGGRTVLDLAREAGVKARIYPVGRLDLKSRGLMILCNDGSLSNRIIHPRYGVEKVYRARINLPITQTQMKRFKAGLALEDGRTQPCGIRELRGRAIYEVRLREGRKRQIRRMFEVLNRKVLDLERVAIGPLRLEGLREGEMRELRGEELRRLKEAVGLS